MEKYYRWFLAHWVEVLVGCYIFFIIFTTVVPFKFVFDISFIPRRFHRIEWIPLFDDGRLVSHSDTIANIVFFFPLGILLGLRKILREYRNWLLREWLQVIASGFAVSFFVEFLQIFTYNRQPSVNDLLMNTAGTVLGAAFILVLYLRFHAKIKSVLFAVFARKTEMIIAGLFFIFIFTSQSAPFTFNISLKSVTAQLNELLAHPFSIEYLWSELLLNLLIYGSFTYFLFSGIFRYHRQYIFGKHWFYIVSGLLVLPVILEVYQFLLPQRNHALSDVLLAWSGMLFGVLFALSQSHRLASKAGTKIDLHEWYSQQHNLYFILVSIIYLVYLANRFLFPFHPVHKWEIIEKYLQLSFSWSPFYLLKINRLNFLISLLKETFAFLPLGFILSLGWFVRKLRPPFVRETILFSVLLPGIFYGFAILVKKEMIIWPDVLAGILGVWLGSLSWQIYHFMTERVK